MPSARIWRCVKQNFAGSAVNCALSSRVLQKGVNPHSHSAPASLEEQKMVLHHNGLELVRMSSYKYLLHPCLLEILLDNVLFEAILRTGYVPSTLKIRSMILPLLFPKAT